MIINDKRRIDQDTRGDAAEADAERRRLRQETKLAAAEKAGHRGLVALFMAQDTSD